MSVLPVSWLRAAWPQAYPTSDYEHWSHADLVAFAERSRTEVNNLRAGVADAVLLADLSEAALRCESDSRDQDFADHEAEIAGRDSTIKGLAEELDKYRDKWNRTEDELVQLKIVLSEVLGTFKYKTHPGLECRQSDHIDMATINRWHSGLL